MTTIMKQIILSALFITSLLCSTTIAVLLLDTIFCIALIIFYPHYTGTHIREIAGNDPYRRCH